MEEGHAAMRLVPTTGHVGLQVRQAWLLLPPLPRLQLSLLSEVLLFPFEKLKHRDLSCWILEMLHSGYAMAGRKSSV